MESKFHENIFIRFLIWDNNIVAHLAKGESVYEE